MTSRKRIKSNTKLFEAIESYLFFVSNYYFTFVNLIILVTPSFSFFEEGLICML